MDNIIIKQFIETNIDLIEENDWSEFYKKADMSFYNDDQIDELTRTLHSVDIYPEFMMITLPSNYIKVDSKFDDYLYNHPELLQHLSSRNDDTHRAVKTAKIYVAKTNAALTYNVENPPTFIYNKHTSKTYTYAKSYVTDVIVETITIPHGTFANSPRLKSVSFGPKLKTIGPAAFENCTSLEEVIIPDNVKVVGEGAFLNCSSLKKIKFSSNQEKIDLFTCARCINLSEVIIPEGITLIDSKAFRDTQALNYIKFPDSLDAIGEGAFRGSRLIALHLNRVTFISRNAFENNILLSDIDFGIRCRGIDTRAFALCPSLRNVTLPQGIHYLGNSLFADGNKGLIVKYYTPAKDSNWALNWNLGYKTERID